MSEYGKRSLWHVAVLAGILLVCAGLAPVLDNHAGFMSPLNHITMNDVAVAVILAVSLNLILGMTGQFTLGHGGFVAAGAYFAVVVAGKPGLFLPQMALWHDWLGLSVSASFTCISVTSMVGAVLLCAVLGLIVGLPTLRLRGDYLAIATLGFGEIVATIITNSEYLERTYGIRLDTLRQTWVDSFIGRERPPVAQAVAAYLDTSWYMISSFWILGGMAVTVLIVRNIKFSTTGRALLAIREDVIAAEATGVPTVRYKITAFVIGAALAGFGGALLAHYSALNPVTFRFMFSVTIVLFVILGGQGSITGSVVAAAALTILPVAIQRNTVLDANVTEKWRMVVYALLIILAMLFMPRGIFGRYEITDLLGYMKRKLWNHGAKGAQGTKTGGGASAQAGLAAVGADEPDAIPRPPVTEKLLEARSVTMEFGGLRAVDSFALSLSPGELVGLIGPNGAGKTTVFNVLTGVYRPTAGDIEIAGHSIVRDKPHSICARGVARTFQNIRLFQQLSVLDNVQIAQHMHHKKGIPAAILRTPGFFREEAESRANAMRLLNLFRLDHLAEERANALSYGDQRRLEIARALATRPRLLLLDEPAAGMNPTEKRQLMDLIRDIRQRFGLAILVIEHDMKVIMGICERIIVLDYGKTIAQGTPEEIRKHPAVIEAYLGASAKHG